MSSIVKSHTRRTKSGKTSTVKSFTRKSKGVGRLGSSSRYGKEFQQHVHNQFLSKEQQEKAKRDGYVLGKQDNIFNYDSKAGDFYITPGIRELSLTKGVRKDSKTGRVYLKKNRREVIDNLITWNEPKT